MSRAKEKQSSLPLSALSILFFFFEPKVVHKSHQLFCPLPTPRFLLSPFYHCSMLLALARFALSSSFIDHVYDMTGTPLSLFFSRLLKGQEMMRVGGEENTSLH